MTSDRKSANQIQRISVDRLLLDEQNPRLASMAIDHANQEELVGILWREGAVEEVALSIAENGYYEYEPLLVIRDPGKLASAQSYFIVVEGNRRLAAVRLLLDPNLRTKMRATNLPSLAAESLDTLRDLPVLEYGSRQELWTYLGFRHVHGTKSWDAFSKAQYVAQVHEDYGEPLDEIARRIGDRHATVQRLYQGYKVLRQAEKDAGFNKEDRIRHRFYFSHLYTAVDQQEFQQFLGIAPARTKKPAPVPKSKIGNLRELMIWLYGQKSTNTQPLVRTQNPDLNRLRRAIANRQSLALLRQGYNLETAYEASIGDRERFRNALAEAKEKLQQAKATVATGYKGEEDLIQSMEAVFTTAESLLDDMRDIQERQKTRPSRRHKAS